jgi:hypothetical protein
MIRTRSQEAVQVNTKIKGTNLRLRLGLVHFKGQTLKPFLLLIDIVSRKAFCYPITGYNKMTMMITAYKKSFPLHTTVAETGKIFHIVIYHGTGQKQTPTSSNL